MQEREISARDCEDLRQASDQPFDESPKLAKKVWRDRWWAILDIPVGAVPLPVYLTLIGVISLFVLSGKFPTDLTIMIAVLSVGGFFFMELGRRVPLIGSMGLAAIMAFVVPSAMVHFGLIPASVAGAINGFIKASNFLYLYIAVVIVGSILSMDRQVLIAGFLKIFIPLSVGSVLAAIVGTIVGCAVGMSAQHAFFMVVIPIMSGGLGEGAIPLSIGYALITKTPEAQLFGQVIPVVMLSGFTAILLCGLLNMLGKRYPELTGEGTLQAGVQSLTAPLSRRLPRIEPAGMAAAISTMVLFYLIGVLAQRWWEFPAPVAMLVLVVIAKLARLVSPMLEAACQGVYQVFSSIVTWPLLFAMGVALTPWGEFVSAFTWPVVTTVFCTVSALITGGFVTAKWLGMYPIDTAIVVGCHSGQGGTGDIAILTAANRMQLMPFAQISTRIGGAANITIALLAFRHFA